MAPRRKRTVLHGSAGRRSHDVRRRQRCWQHDRVLGAARAIRLRLLQPQSPGELSHVRRFTRWAALSHRSAAESAQGSSREHADYGRHTLGLWAQEVTLAPGTRFGPYVIQSAIGAGGMGEVYRATDTSLGRDVAIKVLPAVFAQDPERVARFEREAKTLASLNHPNIAIIHGLEKS